MSQEKRQVGSVPRIDFETYRLANGLQVIFHEDHKLPVVHVNLWYHVGSKNEQPGKTGFAHLFEHMMFEGSRNVKGEYISLMERAGANISQGGINGTTNFDRTNYFETVPSGSLELVLWAESDRMGYLLDAVTQENLDNQRDVVKNERRQSMDNVPYGAAVEILFQNLFPPGHPYSWHINMEDIEGASLEDVHGFFRRFSTNNRVLKISIRRRPRSSSLFRFRQAPRALPDLSRRGQKDRLRRASGSRLHRVAGCGSAGTMWRSIW